MFSKRDLTLSKTLSWILRHGATKEGLELSAEGFIAVSELLNHRSLKDKYTESDVRRVVESNDKQRFALRTNNEILEIRANQGHSLQTVKSLELVPILDASTFENVIHGTYFDCIDNIKRIGLSRMNRNHIHCASGLPNEVLSGARKNAQVFIYIDAANAIKDGIKVFRSANGVILTPGNSQGLLEPKYFLKITKSDGS